MKLTEQEVPHSVAVIVDSMKRDPETDKVHIRATIMVERDSQKGIIIGKKGAMLKKIGKMARRDIEIMLGDKVYLETWVKVKKNWRDKNLTSLTLVTTRKSINSSFNQEVSFKHLLF